MDSELKEAIWQQFGASIDMLENAISECPVALWNTHGRFWYISFHTLFWLDYYLSEEPAKFSPPPNYTLSEFDPDGALPDRVYGQSELLGYLQFGRQKGYDFIDTLNPEKLKKRFVNAHKDYSMVEILLYNMRHVQHHAAQLNLILRQEVNYAPKWVSRAKQAF